MPYEERMIDGIKQLIYVSKFPISQQINRMKKEVKELEVIKKEKGK